MEHTASDVNSGKTALIDLMRVMRFLNMRGLAPCLTVAEGYVSVDIPLKEGPFTLDVEIYLDEASDTRWLRAHGFLPLIYNPRKPRRMYKAVELLNSVLYPMEFIVVEGSEYVSFETAAEYFSGLSEDKLIAQVVLPTLHVLELVTAPLIAIAQRGAAAETSIAALMKPPEVCGC